MNRLNVATPAFYINTQGFGANISTDLICISIQRRFSAPLCLFPAFISSQESLVVLWQSFLSSFSTFRKPSVFAPHKSPDPTKWWKAVKNLAGYTSDKSLQSVINENQILEGKNLANTINESFVSVNKSMPPLSDFDKQFLNTPCEYYIPVELVERRLERVKISKASGPDSIPNCLLKNFSAELATPVASIFNASIVQAQVLSQWKVADVIPIPKSHPVQDINNDIRPISLTASYAI